MEIVFPLESPFVGEIRPLCLFDWFLWVLTEKTFIEKDTSLFINNK